MVHHPVDDYLATVESVEDIARDTRRVVLKLDKPMIFNPGQYVTIAVPGSDQTRTYSMANPPSEPDRIELQIRRTPGGLATDGWIFTTLAAGDEIPLSARTGGSSCARRGRSR